MIEWVHRDWSGSNEAKKDSSMSKMREKMLGCEWNGSSHQGLKSKKERRLIRPQTQSDQWRLETSDNCHSHYEYYWHLSRENRLYSRSIPIFQSSSDDFVWVAPLSQQYWRKAMIVNHVCRWAFSCTFDNLCHESVLLSLQSALAGNMRDGFPSSQVEYTTLYTTVCDWKRSVHEVLRDVWRRSVILPYGF